MAIVQASLARTARNSDEIRPRLPSLSSTSLRTSTFGFGELDVDHGAFVDSAVSEKMPRLRRADILTRGEAGDGGGCGW